MAGFEKPPKEDVFRAFAEPMELRAGSGEAGAAASEQDATGNTLRGHFAVFDSPTIIDSYYEGRFCEVIAPGAFTKTFAESRDQIRVLLGHGYDPTIGDKPIGTISELREDDTGAYYEVSLLDGLDPLVVAGLRAGQYGASFRFKVMREEWEEKPGASASNPDGLPLRTLKEVAIREFGPCAFGQYADATAEMAGSGMRMLAPMGSLTDEVIIERMAADPERLRSMVDQRTLHMAAFSSAIDTLRVEAQAAADDTELEARTDEDAPELEAPADAEDKESEDDARRNEKQDEDEEAPANPAESGDKATPRDYLHGRNVPPWYIA